MRQRAHAAGRRHALEAQGTVSRTLPPCLPLNVAAADGGIGGKHQDAASKKRKLAGSGGPAPAGGGDDALPAAAQVAQTPPSASDDMDERDNQPSAKKLKGNGGRVAEVERQTAAVSGIMSGQTFNQLDLTEQTKRAIAEMGFLHMTEVQARTIPQLLVGRDVLGAAKTGEAGCGGRSKGACAYCAFRGNKLQTCIT